LPSIAGGIKPSFRRDPNQLTNPVLHGHYISEKRPNRKVKLRAYYKAGILLWAVILVNKDVRKVQRYFM